VKNKKIILLSITTAIFTATLLLSSVDASAWGSSESSSYDGGTWGSSGSSYSDTSSGSSWDDGSSGSGGWGGSLTEEDCRICHENLDRFPQLQDINPDKHHLLVGLEIPSSTIAPYGNPGENYECTSCHAVEQFNDVFQIAVERDCLQCHPIQTVTGSPRSENVHHMTETYRQRRCNDCHSILGW
jgi:hypothetical protein